MLGINVTSLELLKELVDVLKAKGFMYVLNSGINTEQPKCAVILNMKNKLFTTSSYEKEFYNWTRSDIEALVLIPEWALDPYLNPNSVEDTNVEMPAIRSWSVRERILKNLKG